MKKVTIPFFGVRRFYKKYSKDILNIVDTVFSHGQVLMGPEVDKFEEKIKLRCQRKHAVAVSSCTDALFFSLLSAGIQPRDEVLITSFSFIASVTPVLRLGAIPVFVDINKDDFMMNLNDLESKITDKTRAVVAVHLFGQCCSIDKLEKIAKKYDLIIIEDAAQSLGSVQKNRTAGSLGLVSSISFDPTKIIGAFGNGGVVLTDDDRVFDTVKKMRYHGKNLRTGSFEFLGFNSRLSTLQAALLNFQLDLLDNLIERGIEIAQEYTKNFKNISKIKTPGINEGNKHIYHKYVILVENRQQLEKYLADQGISTKVHYPKALFEHELFKDYNYRAEDIINVHKIKNQVLSLPIYPELNNEEIEYICTTVRKFFTS
ncbi:MAG: DegT/DnrJ/EryC1/StrS family aminotransferase [bacterium]